ncbi:MAG: hypothetical protein O2895_05610 [Chloroflexi bacterium]|nr:hypothetical protein [Chloroflexota bacterium]
MARADALEVEVAELRAEVAELQAPPRRRPKVAEIRPRKRRLSRP